MISGLMVVEVAQESIRVLALYREVIRHLIKVLSINQPGQCSAAAKPSAVRFWGNKVMNDMESEN